MTRTQADMGGSGSGCLDAFCGCCGKLTLSVRLVRLVVCNVPERSVFSWRCPRCGEAYERVATARDQALLLRAGAIAEPWQIPAEALETHSGRVLDDAEVEGFLHDLEAFGDVEDAPELLGDLPADRRRTTKALATGEDTGGIALEQVRR